MAPTVCFHFCTEQWKIRDQFQWIISKQHPSWKYVTPSYQILGDCDQIGFTKATPPLQKAEGRIPLPWLCVTTQTRLGSRSESSLLEVQCLDKSGVGFRASLRKSSVLGIARLRKELTRDNAENRRASPSVLDPVMGKFSDGIHNWMFWVGCVIWFMMILEADRKCMIVLNGYIIPNKKCHTA